MLYSLKTRKVCTGGVAAIVTRHDGVRVSYSVHPNRAAAFFFGKRMARDLTRRHKAERKAQVSAALKGLRALPGWPVTPAGTFR